MGHPRLRRRKSFIGKMFETLEERRLLAVPVVDAIGNVSVPIGKSIIVPITGSDSDGDALTYAVSTSDPRLTAVIHRGNPYLKLTITHPELPGGQGDMIFELLRDVAPRTVDAISGLAQSGFYNGIIFHRIINNFMIQGGDPTGTGSGGPPGAGASSQDRQDWQFDDEFNVDAIFSGKGQLAMAKSDDDTNGSQFFITEVSTRHLDFNHTIFGQLVRGFDVFSTLSDLPTGANDRPTTPPVISGAQIIENRTDMVVTLKAAGNLPASAVTVTVVANDGTGDSAPRQFTVTPVADTTNSGYFLGPIANYVTPVNTPLVIPVTVSSADSGSLVFDYYPRSISATVSYSAGTGITINPNTGYSGQFDVLVGVLDETSSAGWDTQWIRVGVGITPITDATGLNFPAPVGAAQTFEVATFKAAGRTAADFTAIVNWGDGNLTRSPAVTITQNGDTFTVSGSNTYAAAGIYKTRVTITSSQGAKLEVRGQVTAGTLPVSITPASLSGREQQALFNATLATVSVDPRRLLSSLSATVNWGEGATETATLVPAGGNNRFLVRGSHTYADAGLKTATVTIRDSAGEIASTPVTIDIQPAPFGVDLSLPASLNEGQTLIASGLITGNWNPFWAMTVNYGDGTQTENLALDGTNFTLNHRYDDNALRTITLTAYDPENPQGTATVFTFELNVASVAPSPALSGPASILTGDVYTLTLNATDPSNADTAMRFTYVVNWGDNSPVQTITGAVLKNVTHVYAARGAYTISVTAKDKNNALSAAVTRRVNVLSALVASDPSDAGKTALFVSGTAGNDIIRMVPAAGGKVKALLGSTSLGSFSFTGRIVALGRAGNDTITVDAKLNRPAELYGDAGNDVLTGGPAGDILVGGDGNDRLTGGAGQDLLIGGNGLDSLMGGAGEDLLVADKTGHDANRASLAALMKEWTRADTYARRLARLRRTLAGGRNGSIFLNDASIVPDSYTDLLYGQTEADAFFINNDLGTRDVIKDLANGETAVDAD